MKAPDAGAMRRRAFRAADGFTVETWRAVRRLSGADAHALAGEIRVRLAASGAALVAASAAATGSSDEAARFRRARERLLETRYLLYLARRLGSLDLAGYRRLTAVHDGVERDLAPLAREPPADR